MPLKQLVEENVRGQATRADRVGDEPHEPFGLVVFCHPCCPMSACIVSYRFSMTSEITFDSSTYTSYGANYNKNSAPKSVAVEPEPLVAEQ